MNRLYRVMNEIISRRDESMSACYPHSRKKLIGLGSILGKNREGGWGKAIGLKSGKMFGTNL